MCYARQQYAFLSGVVKMGVFTLHVSKISQVYFLNSISREEFREVCVCVCVHVCVCVCVCVWLEERPLAHTVSETAYIVRRDESRLLCVWCVLCVGGCVCVCVCKKNAHRQMMASDTPCRFSGE